MDKKKVLEREVGQENYNYCVAECEKKDIVNGSCFCKDKSCLINKKRSYTRKKNILKKSKWLDMYEKVSREPLDQRARLYIMCESIIKTTFNSEVIELASTLILGENNTNRGDIIKGLYITSPDKLEGIVDRLLLKCVGYERAERITR